jgi:hypothetical protein
MQTLRRIVLILSTVFAHQSHMAQAQTTTFYDVKTRGVPLGTLTLHHNMQGQTYTATAWFKTTGLSRAFKKVAFTMQSTGTVTGHKFSPKTYAEDMNTGQRRSTAKLRFTRDTTPSNALDPMTALLSAFTPAPHRCPASVPIFDGRRLTRLDLKPTTSTAPLTCSGSLRRINGYTPKQLSIQPKFDLSLHYTNGTLIKARIQTLYGPITVTPSPP